jgi:hypothetical protein
MKLQELAKFDTSLKFVKNNEWPEEILAISALDGLASNSVVFIKNAKFLEKFKSNIEKAISLKIGAIVDEKFFNLVNAESSMDRDFNKRGHVSDSSFETLLRQEDERREHSS